MIFTIIDDIAPYAIVFIIFLVSILIPTLFDIKNPRIILLTFCMLNILFSSVTGAIGVACGVIAIVLYVYLQKKEEKQ